MSKLFARFLISSALISSSCLLSVQPVQAEYETATESVYVNVQANSYSRARELLKDAALEKFSVSYFQAKTGVRNYKLILPYLRSLQGQFLENYREVRQNKDPKTGQIQVYAQYDVKVQELTRYIDQLVAQADLLKQQQAIVLAVDERLDRRNPDNPVLQGLTEQLMIGKDYAVLDQGSFDQANSQYKQILAGLQAKDNYWRQSARALGAEWLVRVYSLTDTELRDQQVANGKVVKAGYYDGTLTLTAEVLHVASGRKYANHLLQLSDRANLKEALYLNLAKRAAQELSALVHDSLTDALLQKSQPQNKLRVLLSGIRSYQNEAAGFIQTIQSIEGVQSIKEVSFGEDTLELEVRYIGSRMNLEQQLLFQVAGRSIDKFSSGADVSHYRLAGADE